MNILDLAKDMQIEIANTIKLLLYKENQSLLEKVDFDDDNVFLEPLLFAYFNSKKDNFFSNDLLIEIMQGYFIEKGTIKIKNGQNTTYVPEFGYFNKGAVVPFESISKIKNTTIEVLKYPIELLMDIFKTDNNILIPHHEIIINKILYDNNIIALTNAFRLIKQNSLEHYKLIILCCKKVLMFRTSPENINSFATINAHGIAFLNVYQDEYDEVFFIDDISHQTGHIILTTLFFDKKAIFKIEDSQVVKEINLGESDDRNIYTLVHAIYTYYACLMCIDDCLYNNSFNEKQQKEAIARIGFYLKKSSSDLNCFDKIIVYFGGIENIFTNDGFEIYSLMKNKIIEVSNKWKPITSNFNYSNQPYNFTNELFIELNT